jgi:hypothetical protein
MFRFLWGGHLVNKQPCFFGCNNVLSVLHLQYSFFIKLILVVSICFVCKRLKLFFQYSCRYLILPVPDLKGVNLHWWGNPDRCQWCLSNFRLLNRCQWHQPMHDLSSVKDTREKNLSVSVSRHALLVSTTLTKHSKTFYVNTYLYLDHS